MGDKTPKRSTNTQNTGFSQIILAESPAAGSPQKNLTGLPRIVRDVVADVFNNIQKWNDLHVKACSVIKEIATLKSDDPRGFSTALEQLMNDLYNIVQDLRNYKDALHIYATQIRASEKLQTTSGPLFISLDLCTIANLIDNISKAYEEEFRVKEIVLENIAFSKSNDETMFLAALWTYQYKITDQIRLKLETLLIESGHRKIT